MAGVYAIDPKLFSSIAFCESHLTQFNDDGTVFRGVVNPKDVGVFQINEKYHLESANKLGLDIKTLEGNIEYAAILLKHQGTQPWSASKNCWKSE